MQNSFNGAERGWYRMSTVNIIDDLSEAFKKQHMTKRKLAEICDLSEGNVSKIFAGKTDLHSFYYVCRLAKALGVSIDKSMGLGAFSEEAACVVNNRKDLCELEIALANTDKKHLEKYLKMMLMDEDKYEIRRYEDDIDGKEMLVIIFS
jgi:transcriptional regulator with XRE-family HTH domain